VRLRHRNDKIEAQACEWLIRVRDTEYDPWDPVPEPSARLEAFLTWISKSPSHLDAARDAVEASRCLRQIDRLRAIEAEALVNRVHNSLSARARYGDAPFDSTLKSAGRPRRPWAIPIALLTLLLVPLHLPTIGALPVSYRADVGQHTFVPLAGRQFHRRAEYSHANRGPIWTSFTRDHAVIR